MVYLVGTDEAGYGPNLGPLVIGGTLWSVPGTIDTERLYDALPGVAAPGEKHQDATRLLIGDSKQLYSPRGSLEALERGVFAALAASSTQPQAEVPERWRQLLPHCDPDCAPVLKGIPWYRDFDCDVPIHLERSELQRVSDHFQESLAVSGVQLLSLSARLIFPLRFNERVRHCGSKGEALSLWTLELIEGLTRDLTAGPIRIHCDKHGGRNRYAALLQHVFPDEFVEVREESRQKSVYRFGPDGRRVEIKFRSGGERFLPSALASMLAKYLRELAMLAFNAYWQGQVQGLRVTAGYPADAKRFLCDIQQAQQKLAIPIDQLWRAK